MAEPVTFERLNTITLAQVDTLCRLLREASPAPYPFFQEYQFSEQSRLAAFVVLALHGEQEIITILQKHRAELDSFDDVTFHQDQRGKNVQIAARIGQLATVVGEIANLCRWKSAPEIDHQVGRLAMDAYHAALQLEYQ